MGGGRLTLTTWTISRSNFTARKGRLGRAALTEEAVLDLALRLVRTIRNHWQRMRVHEGSALTFKMDPASADSRRSSGFLLHRRGAAGYQVVEGDVIEDRLARTDVNALVEH